MFLRNFMRLLVFGVAASLISGCVVEERRYDPYYRPAPVPVFYQIDGSWICLDGRTRWVQNVSVAPGGIYVRRSDQPDPRFYEHRGGNRYRHRNGDTYELRNDNELIWRRRNGREVPLRRQ